MLIEKRKRYILSFLVFAFLCAGIVFGLILLSKNQDNRQQASTGCESGDPYCVCNGVGVCETVSPDGVRKAVISEGELANKGIIATSYTGDRATTSGGCGGVWMNSFCYMPGDELAGGYVVVDSGRHDYPYLEKTSTYDSLGFGAETVTEKLGTVENLGNDCGGKGQAYGGVCYAYGSVIDGYLVMPARNTGCDNSTGNYCYAHLQKINVSSSEWENAVDDYKKTGSTTALENLYKKTYGISFNPGSLYDASASNADLLKAQALLSALTSADALKQIARDENAELEKKGSLTKEEQARYDFNKQIIDNKNLDKSYQVLDQLSDATSQQITVNTAVSQMYSSLVTASSDGDLNRIAKAQFAEIFGYDPSSKYGDLSGVLNAFGIDPSQLSKDRANYATAVAKVAEQQEQQVAEQQQNIDKLNEEYQSYVRGQSSNINDLKDAALAAGLVSASDVSNLSEEGILALLLSKFSDGISLEEARRNANAIVEQRNFSTKEQAMLQSYRNDQEKGNPTSDDLTDLYKLYTGHSPTYRMTTSELEREVSKYSSQLSLSLYAQTQDITYLNNYFRNNFPNAPAPQSSDPKALLEAIYGAENGAELYRSVVLPSKFNEAISNFSNDAGTSLVSVCQEMGLTNCNLDNDNATQTLSLMLDKMYADDPSVNVKDLAVEYSGAILSKSEKAAQDALIDAAEERSKYNMAYDPMAVAELEAAGITVDTSPLAESLNEAEQTLATAKKAEGTFNSYQTFQYATQNRSSISDYTWGLSYGNALMDDNIIFDKKFTIADLGLNAGQTIGLAANQFASQFAGVDVAQNIATNYATSKYYNYTGPADTGISNIALTGAQNLGVLDYNYQSADSGYYAAKTVKSWGENIGQAATYVGSLYAASQMNSVANNQAMYAGTGDFQYVDPIEYAQQASDEFKANYQEEMIGDLYKNYVAAGSDSNVDLKSFTDFVNDPEVQRSSQQLDYERLEKVVVPTAAVVTLPLLIATGAAPAIALGAASSIFSLYQGAGMKAQALELQRIDIQSRENAVVQSYIDSGSDPNGPEVAKIKEDINNQVAALNKQGDLMLASSAVAAVTSVGGWATSLGSAGGLLSGAAGDVAIASGQVLTKAGQVGGIALNSYNTINAGTTAYNAFDQGKIGEGIFSAASALVSASGVAGNTFGLTGPTAFTNKVDYQLDRWVGMGAGSAVDLQQVGQACFSGSDAFSQKDCTNAWIGLALSAGQNVAQISSSTKAYRADIESAQVDINNAKITDIQKQIDAIDTEIIALGGPNKGLREGLQINDLVLQRTLLADQIKTIDPNFKIADITSSKDYTDNVMKISLDLENKAQAAADAGQDEQARYLFDQARTIRNKSDEVAYIREEIGSIDEQINKKGLLLSTSELADLQKNRTELVTELEKSFKDLSPIESVQKQNEVILEITKANTAFEELNKTLAINAQKMEAVETYKPSDKSVADYETGLKNNSDSIKLETDADKRLKSLAVLEENLVKLSDLESQRNALLNTSNADSDVGREAIAKLDTEIESVKKITDGFSTDNRSIFQKMVDAVSPNKESRNAYYESVDLTHEAETLRNKLAGVDADSEEAQGIKEQLANVNRRLVDQKYVLSQDAINPNQSKTIFQNIAEFIPNLRTNRQIADLKTAAKKLGTANLDIAEQMVAKQTEIDKLRAGGPVTSEDATKITKLESEIADLSLTANNILKGSNALIKVDQSGNFTKYTVTDVGEKAGIKQNQLDILNNELEKFETFKRSETGIEKFKIYSGTESFKDQDIFLLAELEAYGSGRRGTVFGALPGMGKTDVVMPFNIMLKQRLTNEPQFIVFPESKLMKPWTSDANYTPNKEFIDYVESEFGKGSVVIIKANDPNVDTAAIAKAKFVIATKEVAFDLQSTGTKVGSALRDKWKNSYIHADEVDWTFNPNENYKVSGQQVALKDKAEFNLYLSAQKKVLGVDENGNFSDKGLSTLRELINQLETSKSIPEGITRTADGKGGKFASTELEKQVLSEWLGTWGGQSRISDLDMSADVSVIREKINNYLSSDTSADTHGRRAELAMINETVNFLSRVPGEDYGLSTNTRTNGGTEETINSIAPKDQNRDTGRSYSAVAESLLYNTLGAKIVGASGQVDLGKLTVGENGSEINYAALMLESKGFSLYTGTPETVSKLYKMAYGIELQTFTDSAVDDSIARFKGSDSKLFTDLESQISGRLAENRDQVFVNMVSGQRSNEMALNDLVRRVSAVDADNKVYKKLMLVGAGGDLAEYDVVNGQLQHVRSFATTSELNTRTAELNNSNERFIKFYEYGAHVGVDTKNNVDISRVIGLCSGCDATTFSQGINRVRVQVETLEGGGSVTKSAPMDVVWLDAPTNKTNPTIDDFEIAIKDRQVVNEALAEVSFKETLLRNSVDSTINDLIDLANNGKKGFLGFGAYKANPDLVNQLETAKQKWKETTGMNYMLGSDDMSAQTKLEKTANQVAAMYEELSKVVSGTGEPAKLFAERADGAIGDNPIKLSFAGDDNYKVLGETPSYRQIVDLINQSSKHLGDVNIAFTNRSSSPEVVRDEVAKAVGANSTTTNTNNNEATVRNNNVDATNNTNTVNNARNTQTKASTNIGFAAFATNLWSGKVDEKKLLAENADLIAQNKQSILEGYQNKIDALNEQLSAAEDSDKESLINQIDALKSFMDDESFVNAEAENMATQQLANDYRSGGLKNLLPNIKAGLSTTNTQPLSALLPGISNGLKNLKNILPKDAEKGGSFTVDPRPLANFIYGSFDEEALVADKQAEIATTAEQLKQDALAKKAVEAQSVADEISRLNRDMKSVTDASKAKTIQSQLNALTAKQNDIKAEQDNIQQQDFTAQATTAIVEKYATDKNYLKPSVRERVNNAGKVIGKGIANAIQNASFFSITMEKIARSWDPAEEFYNNQKDKLAGLFSLSPANNQQQNNTGSNNSSGDGGDKTVIFNVNSVQLANVENLSIDQIKAMNPVESTEINYSRESVPNNYPARNSISRNSHAKVEIDKSTGTLLVADQNSSNGTYVNGFRIAPNTSYLLKDGDHVGIGITPTNGGFGNAVELVVRVDSDGNYYLVDASGYLKPQLFTVNKDSVDQTITLDQTAFIKLPVAKDINAAIYSTEVIGRKSVANITDSSVSREHLLAYHGNDGSLSIEDNNSQNGTYLLRKGENARFRLNKGEIIQLFPGDKVYLNKYELNVVYDRQAQAHVLVDSAYKSVEGQYVDAYESKAERDRVKSQSVLSDFLKQHLSDYNGLSTVVENLITKFGYIKTNQIWLYGPGEHKGEGVKVTSKNGEQLDLQYKLHFAVSEEDFDGALEEMTAYLRELGVLHKIAPGKLIVTDTSNRQFGKAITIYAQDPTIMEEIAKKSMELGKKYRGIGANEMAKAGANLNYEMEVPGTNGLLYYTLEYVYKNEFGKNNGYYLGGGRAGVYVDNNFYQGYAARKTLMNMFWGQGPLDNWISKNRDRFNSLCSDCEQIRLASQIGVEQADSLMQESGSLTAQAEEARNNNDQSLADDLTNQAEAKRQEALTVLSDTRTKIINDHGVQNQCVQTYLNAWVNTEEALIRRTKADIDDAIDSVYKATLAAVDLLANKTITVTSNNGILGIGQQKETIALTDEELSDIQSLLDGNETTTGLKAMADFERTSDNQIIKQNIISGSLKQLRDEVGSGSFISNIFDQARVTARNVGTFLKTSNKEIVDIADKNAQDAQAENAQSSARISNQSSNLDLTQDANKFLDDYVAQLSIHDGVDSAKVNRVRNFFNKDVIDQISGIYNDLLADKETASEEQIANIKANLQFVLERAFDQHLDNPEQYVSHGFDHTLNVVKYTNSIIEANPELIQKVQDKYGIGANEAKFLLKTVSLFHDFGYPVSEASKLGKAAHGMAGADIINYGKVNVDGQETLLRDSLLKLMNSDNQEIIFDLRDGILFHSADKVERNYGVKIKTSRGDFLLDNNEFIRVYNAFSNDGGKPTSVEKVYVYADDESSAEEIKNQLVQALESDNIDAPIPEIEFVTKKFEGRKVDLLSKKDNLLGLEFSEVALMTSPLQAIIRLADNMDMQTDRFSPIQREPLFQAFYKELGNPESELYIDNLGFENLLDKAEKAAKADKTSQDTADRISDLKEGIAAFIASYKQSKGGDADEAFSQAMDDLNNLDIGASEDYWKSFVFGEIAKRPAFANVTDERAAEIKNIALEQNSSSYRHFGGCEAVRGVKVTPEGVFVEVDQDVFDNLNKTKVEEESLFSSISVGVGEYQIWRMSQAYASIRFQEGDSELPIFVNGKRYYEGASNEALVTVGPEVDSSQLNFNSLCSDCEQVRLTTQAGVEQSDALIKESDDLFKQAIEAKNNNDQNLANDLTKQAESKKQEALKKLNDTRYQIVNDYGRQNQCVQTYLNAWINTREALIRKTKADIDNAIDSVYKATVLAEEMMDSKQMAIKTNTILGMGGETVYKPLTEAEVDDIGDLLFGNKEKNIEGLQSWAAFDIGSDGKLSRTVLKGSLLNLDNSVVADKVSPIRVFLRNFAISSRQLLVMDHLKQVVSENPALLLNFAKLQISISPVVSVSPAISITPAVSTSPTPVPSTSPTPTPSQAAVSITPVPSSAPSSANENGLNWRTILNVLAATLSLTLFGSIINNLSVVKASEVSSHTTETAIVEEVGNKAALTPTPTPKPSNSVADQNLPTGGISDQSVELMANTGGIVPSLPVKKVILDTALPSKYIVSDPYAKYTLQPDGTILFTERDEWNPVNPDLFPDYTTNRNAEDYLKTIKLFNVDASKRYRRDSSVTYCNIYVSDVTNALGVPIPRWENGEKMDADDMYYWLQGSFAQEELGWKEVTATQAQNLANQGVPTVATTPRYKVSGGTMPGHIAMVIPGDGEIVDGIFYPSSAQAGRINFDDGSLTLVGFSGAINHEQEIKYYVNDSNYEFVQP